MVVEQISSELDGLSLAKRGSMRSGVGYKVLMWSVVFALFGCAPSLGAKLRVDRFPVASTSTIVLQPRSRVQIRVGEVTDMRADPSVATIDGRSIPPDGEVGLAVREAISNEVVAAGGSLSQFDGSRVDAEILTWHVGVQPGFPSTKVNAKATVRLNLFDAHGGKLYAGIYRGATDVEHPLFSQERVEQALAQAMQYALSEAFSDEAVRRALALQSQL